LRDLKPTPLDSRAVGASINATFMDNLLNGSFVVRIQPIISGLIAFALCLLVALGTMLFAAKIRHEVLAAILTLTMFAVVLAGYTWIAVLLYKQQGLWIDLAAPGIGALMAWGTAVGANVYEEMKSRRFVQDALGRYTSPELVRVLLKNPRALSLDWGERRKVTVFFSDVAGFTSISERLGPEKVVALLNEYLTEMTEIILDEKAIVDKYIGDAIMAFWGAPIKDADHAMHACRAALRTSKRLGELQAEWQKRFGEKVDFRAGINSGLAIVGNMGSRHKYNYTVMGDTVNLASRLEGANKVYGTRIMIAQGTKELVENQFVARRLDLLAVKGKDLPVEVYELVGEVGQTDESVLTMIDRFEMALAVYREGRFGQAAEDFAVLCKDFPDDGPAAVYLERSRAYAAHPPAKGWDGVFRMTTK